MRKQVFLVEDDPDDQFIFREALIHCDPDLELAIASDGVKAIDFLKESTRLPDIIFLDYNMPQMNGLECLRNIKANPKTASVPVIIYTTSGNAEEERNVRESGAEHCIKKHMAFEDFCHDLHRILNTTMK